LSTTFGATGHQRDINGDSDDDDDFIVNVGSWDPVAGVFDFKEGRLKWDTFYPVDAESQPMSSSSSGVVVSVCSVPCRASEYVIPGDQPCCWTCRQCRSGEVVNSNRTGCQKCPVYSWPDDSDTVCVPIAPTFLSVSDPISAILLLAAAVTALFSLSVMAVFDG